MTSSASHRSSILFTRRSWIGAGVLLVALGSTACSQAGSSADSVSLEEARKAAESGKVILIDVREPQEHATGVVAGARLLPTSQIQGRWAEIPTDASKPVLLVCNTQNRSSSVLRALREQGPKYDHVRYVQGGMSEWNRRGWPVVAPKP